MKNKDFRKSNITSMKHLVWRMISIEAETTGPIKDASFINIRNYLANNFINFRKYSIFA